jgi:hypothetical protein
LILRSISRRRRSLGDQEPDVDGLEVTICDFKILGRSPEAPLRFTEQGVAMLSGVFRSPRAVQVNVEIPEARHVSRFGRQGARLAR